MKHLDRERTHANQARTLIFTYRYIQRNKWRCELSFVIFIIT